MENLTYIDLLVMQKIDENSVIEKFGPVINTSFFEAANLLGTLKVKGYVDLDAAIGGMSRVSLTEHGRDVMKACSGRSLEALDDLDDAIIAAIGRGISNLDTLVKVINVRSGDLAIHLNKLVVQGFIESQVKSGKAELALTEKGFNKAGKARGIVEPVHSKPAAGQGQQAKAQGGAPDAQAAHRPLQISSPEDIARDVRDILSGFFEPKKQGAPTVAQASNLSADDAPSAIAKEQASAVKNSATGQAAANFPQSKAVQQDNAVKYPFMSGNAAVSQPMQAPGVQNVPAQAFSEAKKSEAKITAIGGPGTHSDDEKSPSHPDIKAMRAMSKAEYYIAKAAGFLMLLVAIIAGVALAIIILGLFNIKVL